MIGWLTSAKRIGVLERDLGATRATLAQVEERLASQAEAQAASGREEHAALSAAAAEHGRESERMRRDLAELSERIGRSEDSIASLIETLATASGRLDRDDDAARGTVVQCRMSLLRLERQLDVHAEETRKLVLGLLQRIEAVRPTRD